MNFYGNTHLNVSSYENNWIQYEGSKISMVHWFISRFHNQQERGETIFKQVQYWCFWNINIYIYHIQIYVYIYIYNHIYIYQKQIKVIFSWNDQVIFQDFIQDSCFLAVLFVAICLCLLGGSGGTCCDRFGRGQVPFSQLRVLWFEGLRKVMNSWTLSFFGFLWIPKYFFFLSNL